MKGRLQVGERRVVVGSEGKLVDITILFESPLSQIQDLEKDLASWVLITQKKAHPKLVDYLCETGNVGGNVRLGLTGKSRRNRC